MTTKSETTKREVIRKAYGEHWDKLKDYIDIDGNCVMLDRCHNQVTPNFSELGFERDYVEANIDNGYNSELGVHEWRPKTLRGIDNNNGWFSIEEHGLPKEEVEYRVILDGKYLNKCCFDVKCNQFYDFHNVTHWKPLEKELLPHY